MAIPDMYSVRRILCSLCPHIHLSWTTQWTSLLKCVGCPAPALFYLLFETQGWSPTGHSTYCKDNIQVQFLFYSTFEVLDLLCSGLMETGCVVKLYKPSPMPILYGAPSQMC